MHETRTQALFLRAGQLDDANGQLRRIRQVAGVKPRDIQLHLVYNGTRSLLADYERIDTASLAQLIAETFSRDRERAICDGAQIVGLQLDLDVPTRLLPRYAQLLAATRKLLPAGIQLSITGLPAWLDLAGLDELLRQTDFWIPQCYGGAVPQTADQAVPIAAASQVRRTIERVRQLRHPFYAGLSAYGYAILYSANGRLTELRGDLDPALAATHPDLELIERRLFEANDSEWRYLFRARGGMVIDGLVMNTGDLLMLDVPTAAGLRVCARAVREAAGESLLGICVFRLPSDGDPTTLTAGEIAAALNDRDTVPAATVSLTQSTHLNLSVTNSGTAAGPLSGEAVVVTVQVPKGSISGISALDGFAEARSLCRSEDQLRRPCSLRRAEFIQLSAINWRPGQSCLAELKCAAPLPAQLNIEIEFRTDDGRSYKEEQTITVSRTEQP